MKPLKRDLSKPQHLRGIVQKTVDGSHEFIASNETEDRYNDIIRVSGWELKNYHANPIVLWQHNNASPIGNAVKVGVRDGALRANIKIAETTVDPTINLARALLDEGIIKAVSVGFRPLKTDFRRADDGEIIGYEFKQQELTEISLVSVPALPSALEVSRSLGISDEDAAKFFYLGGDTSLKVKMLRLKLDLQKRKTSYQRRT